MNIVSTVYNVPAFRLPGLQAKIDKLNKRCRRLRLPEITVRVLRSYTEEVPAKERGDAPEQRPYNEIEVTGARPQLGGWEFAATFEHDAETRLTILRRSDAFKGEIPAEYRKASAICDHCKLDRRRNDTFLVHSEEKGFRQIGRNCLRDFLGHGDPHSYASAAEVWFDLSEIVASESEYEGEGGGSREIVFDLESFVQRSFAVVRVRGFLGRAKVRETGEGIATADRIVRLLCPTSFDRESRIWKDENNATQITPADEERAAGALEWIRSQIGQDKLSDYLHNLSVACASEFLPSRRVGIVASLPAAYLKHLDKAEELRKARENKPVSAFVGTVGERQTFTAKLDKVIAIPSDQWGTSYLHKFTDAAGNSLAWFSSSLAWAEGGEYEFSGTVKEHEAHERFGNQTLLSRCKVLARLDDPKLPNIIGYIGRTEAIQSEPFLCIIDLATLESRGSFRSPVELVASLPKKATVTWLDGAEYEEREYLSRGGYSLAYPPSTAAFDTEVRPLFPNLPALDALKASPAGEIAREGALVLTKGSDGYLSHYRSILHRLENAPAPAKKPRKAKAVAA